MHHRTLSIVVRFAVIPLIALSPAATASDPCPDLTGDGVVDSAELNIVLGAFGQAVECPPAAASCAVVRDVRQGIHDADTDPPAVQRNYDAINRTVHLFGDYAMADLFALPLEPILTAALERAADLTSPCAPPTDAAALQEALAQAIDAAGPLPLFELVAAPPGAHPEARGAMDALRSHGIGLPPFPSTPDQSAEFAFSTQILIDAAPMFTYADFYELPAFRLLPQEAAAIEGAKTTGILNFTAVSDDGVTFAIRDNDRCYKTNNFNLSKCYDGTDSFCKIRKIDQQADGSGIPLAGSDKCP